MNNFFKMSLIAAAVAVSGTATAGTMTSITNSVFSSEGVVLTTTAEQNIGGFSYTVGTDYEAGAAITFTYSAGALGAGTVFPASITTTAVAPSTGFMTLTKSAQTADSVTYTVTAKQGGGTVISNIITIPSKVASPAADGVTINTSAIKAGPVTVKASAVYQTVAFDPDTTVTTALPKANYLASTSTQFGSYTVATPLAGKINVNTTTVALDKILVASASDTLIVTYAAPTTMPAFAVVGAAADSLGNDLSATTLTQSLNVTGKFPSFKVTDFVSTGNTAALTSTGFKVTSPAASAPVASVTAVILPTTANDALSVQDFTVVPSVVYGTTTKTFSSANAGEWTVDAELANIPYMPYGTDISQIIYVTNVNATDAQVSATATDEAGNAYSLGVIGTAKGNGAVTKFTTPIKTALANLGFTSGKVSIDLTFVGLSKVDGAGTTITATTGSDFAGSATATLAKGTIKINSAYNINGTDRGFVSNTTNGSN